jgi:hypothetical protein
MTGIAMRKTVIELSIGLALGVSVLIGCQQNAALRPTCEVNDTCCGYRATRETLTVFT